MLKIKLSTYNPPNMLLKQTPGNSGAWAKYKFFINQAIGKCDYWIVYDNLPNIETTLCPPANTLLITGEPSAIRKYDRKFAQQFAAVITCQRSLKHPNPIYTQQAMPWRIGFDIISQEATKDYDFYKRHNFRSNKKKLLSLVVSAKKSTRGHRQRLAFVQQLQAHFKDRLDVFGGLANITTDKWEAIRPYKYSIAIENCSEKDYWTEKLADVFLGGAYPIYYGCPNIHDYFSKNSLAVIDINDITESIRTIEQIINSDKFEKSQAELRGARDLILDKYNLFEVISEWCQTRSNTGYEQLTIRPQQPKSQFRRMFVDQANSLIRGIVAR